MDDRRTQYRREEDQRHSAEVCHFIQAKEYYDTIARQQDEKNTVVMNLLTRLNDNLQEYKDGSDEQLTDILDQVKIQVGSFLVQIEESETRDQIHDNQFKEIFNGIEELRAYVNMQSEDIDKASNKIQELKTHMDNGWKNDLLADMKSMVDDLRKQNRELMNVVVQKSATQSDLDNERDKRERDLDNERDKRAHDLKMKKQDNVFKLLIGATASGGLILSVIQLLSK